MNDIVRAAQAGPGGPVTIACINKAKTPLGVDFGKLTAALQKCYDEFFVPVWGYPVKLYNTTKGIFVEHNQTFHPISGAAHHRQAQPHSSKGMSEGFWCGQSAHTFRRG